MRATIIATAPNGGRKTKADHPYLPLTTDGILRTAEECLNAGSAFFHLHIRDDNGKHTLDAQRYKQTLQALKHCFHDDLFVQITTESVGLYQPHEQIQSVKEVHPEAVSLGLKEIIPSQEYIPQAQEFFHWLEDERIHYQIILYHPDELLYLKQLMEQNIIPKRRHSVLFVLGRYEEKGTSSPLDLIDFIANNKQQHLWMVCAFGILETTIAQAVISLGGDMRVGFENNLYLPNGELAQKNSDLVKLTTQSIQHIHKKPATAQEIRHQLEALFYSCL
ncbi:MAG: 3-keto-5-aminohexanoate cleavage protein [Alphaproteobacteria bacterium]